MKINVAAKTDKGRKRKNNEDSMLVRPSLNDEDITEKMGGISIEHPGALFAVADGMGGHLAGEVASMLAIEAIEESVESGVFKSESSDAEIREIMENIFLKAQNSLIERAKEDPRTEKMGTTLVIGIISQQTLHVAWLGDSRCYHYRSGSRLNCVTKDHNYAQMLVDAGRITMDQAFEQPGSSIITRSLICIEGDDPTPDYRNMEIGESDRILFCSDGLNGMLRDQEIEKILETEKDTRTCVVKLVSAANEKGGKDNISAVLVDVIICQ
jgi:protein phosphatase